MTITAELHDGTRLEFPDGTPQSVIQDVVRKQMDARQLWRPATKVQMGDDAVRSSITAEAEERSPVEQIALGFGTAPQFARAALTQERKPRSTFDAVNEAAIQLNPVSRALSKLQDLVRPERGAVTEQAALRDATPYTKGGNIAGNVAMTALLPSSVGRGYARAGAAIPGFIGTRTGAVVDSALTQGTINAGITPGDDVERMIAAISAGGTSAAVPAALGIAQAGRRAVTAGGKRVAIGESLRSELGPQADNVARALQARSLEGQRIGTRPSASMMTADPTLEALEAGSRTKRGDLWRKFDQDNAAARWNALRSAAGTPEATDAMRQARDAATGPLRDEALGIARASANYARGGGIDLGEWGNNSSLANTAGKSLINKVQDWRGGDLVGNPDVQTIAGHVEKVLKSGGTPGQLYELRKWLTDGIKAGAPSDLSNAVKNARVQRNETVGMIDDVLDHLSAGTWRDYLARYRSESPTIASKQALQKMVDSLERGQPLGAVPTMMGESPAWKTFGNLRDRFGEKQFGSKTFDQLIPEDRATVELIAQSLKAQSDAMSSKGILGSHTAAMIANAGRSDNVARRLVEEGASSALHVPGASAIAQGLANRGIRIGQEQLATLLQNPQMLAEAIQRASAAAALTQGAQGVGAAGGRVVADQINR